MRSYVCTICGYVYNEAKGIPESGIPAGTRWEDIPEDWVCPLCGAKKSDFEEKEDGAVKTEAEILNAPETEKELSAMEISIICSNLARGCEKQYMDEEAGLFSELAGYFRTNAKAEQEPDFDSLLKLVQRDLETGYPYANAISSKKPDRGAQRALVWSEKVTRMLNSLLKRYVEEGDEMLEHSGVYICTICGFVYVGDSAPELCPVCKVPNWKFEKIEGGAV